MLPRLYAKRATFVACKRVKNEEAGKPSLPKPAL